MSFDNFQNIISLICTVIGLLYCVFKFIETPKRGYRVLIAFFLADFLSEYYRTIYELLMHADPNISGFITYLGWNIGYFFLFLAILSLRREGAKKFFSPLMLLPLIVNIPQFLLYIRHESFLNSLWKVGVTTATMVLCLQEIAYYRKKKEDQKVFPWFSVFLLMYLFVNYGMWTVSCFTWKSEVLDPYFYLTLIASALKIPLVFGVKKFYSIVEGKKEEKSTSVLRFQMLLQAIVSLVTVGICFAGVFLAVAIKNSIEKENGIFKDDLQIVIYLFVTSFILIFLVLIMLHVFTTRYKRLMDFGKNLSEGKRSWLNFIFTIVVTLALMVFSVIYNGVVLYNVSVLSVYENGTEEIETTATELENYLSVASTTLRIEADSVELLVRNGKPMEEIIRFIEDQTVMQAEQFDENFTGIYAYINGEYLDGQGWVPPEDYDPTDRDWYKTAVVAKGDIVIVSPYVDAQTGDVVVTIAKRLSDTGKGDKLQNVVCLDVTVKRIQEIAKVMEIGKKSYGMVVNTDGFIIAHSKEEYNGEYLDDVYKDELLKDITSAENSRKDTKINNENCTIFVSPVMEQWYAVIVVENTQLFEDTYLQLGINIMVSLITFCLISFFYYVGYKNEQFYGKRVEELNLQVVGALAAAIDAKDNYTNGHSSRVAKYAEMIAARTGYSQEDQDSIYMMGLLHDVGKIGVPDEVINKPSKLTDEEFEYIKKHPVIGGSILGSIKERPKLAEVARWHHERYGGGGYPDGISKEDIPEEARIVAVADAYDAMTSRRSYRDVMPQEKVYEQIKNGMGTQFDPKYAEAMLKMIEEDTEYNMREKTEEKKE